MASVKFESASRTYSDKRTPAVDKLNLDIADGELFVLTGPSGSGKSTSLRMLAGLEDVDSGDIWIGDRNVTNLSVKERDVAMVFQNYALYPHKSVADNLGFALRIAGIDDLEIAHRIADTAKVLDLGAYLEHRPTALTDSQRHRVAMGRAIARQPQVLLMDEPLSSLDANLRTDTQAEIASLHQRLGLTTIYVTQNQVEAMTMGSRVAVLRDGSLQQCDTPRRLHDHPANVFVAGFVGAPAMNLIDVAVVDGGVRLGSVTHPVQRDLLADAGHELTLGVRPEALTLTTDGQGIPVTIEVVDGNGAEACLYGSTLPADGDPMRVVQIAARLNGGAPPKVGSVVHLRPMDGHVHVFHAETGLRIGD